METGRYTLKQAAKLLGRHYLTVYRWEKQGKIRPAKRYRHEKGPRIYTDQDIQEIREKMDRIYDPALIQNEDKTPQ